MYIKILKCLDELKNASIESISQYLNIKDLKELKSVLIMLIQNNAVKLDSEKMYSLNLSKNEVIGLFRGNKNGYGFISPLNEKEDFYVYHSNQRGAIDGDIVIGIVTRMGSGDKKAEAKVRHIITPNSEKYVGIFTEVGSSGYVSFENKTINKNVYISAKARNGANDGDVVMFKITDRATKEKEMKGVISEVIGNKMDSTISITAQVRGKGIPIQFSSTTMEQISKIPNEINHKELASRTDLRDELVITIDGEDSKDLDDAISLVKLDNGNYKLGVHIADVAHYVKEDTPLDQEAKERGTSVYLVDRVIPMLPKELSNGICSLNPNVDRLTLSCIMEVDKEGQVVNSEVLETVICSNERMTYTDVKNILNGDNELINKYSSILSLLGNMKELAEILMEKRNLRGSIDFDLRETKVILNDEGQVSEIKAYDRNIATRIIEEFMILANETIAEKFHKLKLPFVYRIHSQPEGKKVELLKSFLSTKGLYLTNQGKISPLELQMILKESKGKPEEFSINHIILRSLSKAKYDMKNIEHFGLSSKYYTHFTSPIRRYPDLQIHRIIKEYIRGELNSQKIEHYFNILSSVAEQSSKREVRAQEAERDSVEMKKCEYMSDKIGTLHSGVVVGITEYGVYVELENTIQGLIHISNLGEKHYEYDELSISLIDEENQENIELGSKMNVKVKKVNVEKREIDFELVKEGDG